MIGGGESNLDYKPILPNGQREYGVEGCHVGTARNLNVHNPQSGFVYFHERRTEEGIRRGKGLGYELVGKGDPEYLALDDDPKVAELGLDNSRVRADTVLMRMPEAAYQRRLAEEQASRMSPEEVANAESYLSEKVPLQELYEQRTTDGRNLKFQYTGHAARVEAIPHKNDAA